MSSKSLKLYYVFQFLQQRLGFGCWLKNNIFKIDYTTIARKLCIFEKIKLKCQRLPSWVHKCKFMACVMICTEYWVIKQTEFYWIMRNLVVYCGVYTPHSPSINSHNLYQRLELVFALRDRSNPEVTQRARISDRTLMNWSAVGVLVPCEDDWVDGRLFLLQKPIKPTCDLHNFVRLSSAMSLIVR